MKIEQRKVRGLECGPQVQQTALLASPVYTGHSQEEKTKYIKRGAKIEPLSSFGSPLTPRGCSFLCLPSKTELYLNCNIGLPFQIFAAARQN